MTDNTPAYLLVGMTRKRDLASPIPPEVQRYGKAAQLAAAAVGVDIGMVARGEAGSTLNILEGGYSGGTLIIERYSSMQGVHDFWSSPEYLEAKKLRSGPAFPTFHFIVAFEGFPPDVSGPAPGEDPLAYTVTCGFGGEMNTPKMQRYIELASRIDRGYTPQALARAAENEITVLEGAWPYSGGVQIKSHPSVDAVKNFWNHPTYVEAKKHRRELALQAVIPGVEPLTHS